MALPEIALVPGSLAVADLHLDVERPESTAPFLAWLAGLHGVPRLLVLGDLFEFWIGPAQAATPGAGEVMAALADLRRRGTELDVVPGNRDFLLDAVFERETGARLRPQGVVGRTAAGRVLFLHGDELSTLDRGHVRLRRILRSGAVRWLAPRLPRRVAAGIARRLRRASRAATGAKPPEEMALQPGEVGARARAAAADVLVCGHAHRFRDERLAGGPRWIVLDAWGGTRDLLEVDPAGGLAVRGTGIGAEVPA